jgi:hypothetical protein
MLPEFELDPSSIHFNVGFDITDSIKASISTASAAAIINNQPYILYYEEVDGQPNYKVESKDRMTYMQQSFTCPQDADKAYFEQTAEPRPVPSAACFPPKMVSHKPEVVVASNNLCDTCVHRLNRAVKGNCQGLIYKPLID